MTRAGAVAENADPRAARTRTRLRDALVSLLGERDFGELAIHDLAERAGINRATFYDHYRDKFALLDDLVDETFRQALAPRLAAHAGTGPRLRPLALAVGDYLAGLRDRCGGKKKPGQPLLQPLVEARVKVLLHGLLLDDLRALDRARLRVAPDLGATLAAWSLYGAASDWTRTGGTDATTLANAIVPAVAAALFI